MIYKVVLLAELSVLLSFYWSQVAEKKIGRGPMDLFLVFHAMNYASVLLLADLTRHSLWVLFICVGLHGVVFGAWLAKRAFRFSHRKEIADFASSKWINDVSGTRLHLILVALVISGVFVVVYYWYLGFFVPLEALRAYGQQGDVSQLQGVYSEYRKIAHYGTQGYYAPGYFGQFKDALLPVIVVLLGFVSRIRRSAVWAWSTGFLFFFTVLGLVGTGRRFPVMAFLASIFLLCTWRALRPFVLSRTKVLYVSLSAFIVFGFLSSLMGRGDIYGDLWSNIVRGPLFLFERIAVQGQEQRLVIFDLFLKYTEPSWGLDWIGSLSSVLPGSQLVLANELHGLLFGSEIGSAGLDLWGELWLNFAWLGPVLVAPIWGFLLQAYYVRLIRGRKAISRVVVLLYGGFLLAMSFNPIQLFIQGFVTLMLFRLLLGGGVALLRPALPVKRFQPDLLRMRRSHGVR